jgi:hypothetical protein
MAKPNRSNRRPRSRKPVTTKNRRLCIRYQTHHELLQKLGKTIGAISSHLGSTAAAGRQGTAVAAAQKTFIGYDEALNIVLDCSGRTGPEDPVVDPQAPPATRDQIVQCILKKVHDEGFSLAGPLSIGDADTCDVLAAEVQYASN